MRRLKVCIKSREDYELAGKGNAYVRIDGEAKVTGKAIYTDDVYFPDMYYCKLVHSPYAHALIKSIDFTEALESAGREGRCSRERIFPRGITWETRRPLRSWRTKNPCAGARCAWWATRWLPVCAVSEGERRGGGRPGEGGV